MTPPLHAAEPQEVVFRCGRHPDPWAWPDWSYAAEDGTFGNRFDDPDGEYRVLYASSERQAAFRECLARFRPDPAVVAARIDDQDDDAPATAAAGTIPAAWLENRRMGTARLNGSFCDIGHSNSLEYLRTHMAARLLDYELDDLDAGDIRARAPRRLTQEISRCVFVQARDDGSATFAGIRYASRLGDELTNWAIFEPNEPTDIDAEQVDPDDPDLLNVLTAYSLQVAND